MFISVDFPAPFSPTRASGSPRRTDSETPSQARTPGNRLVMLSSSSCWMGRAAVRLTFRPFRPPRWGVWGELRSLPPAEVELRESAARPEIALTRRELRLRARETAKGESENVPRQVLVEQHALEARLDVLRIDDELLAPLVGRVEADLVEEPLHHGVEPARAAVLHTLFHVRGDARDLLDRVLGDLEVDALRGEERDVLLHERVLRLAQDAHQALAPERLELDADRESPLELGDEVGHLRDVERAGRDEEDVV